ncbi:energy-coupling factor transport system substrate-specific component [Methanococcus maripaludis]|uniref:Energy-coupling factor transport system substrate-specific component n=1 Tax=Methanococcus maripaludis TaxID=39152 RepID=A0A7J9P5X4_METMI|nr:ECF transporter S component [Methanococcus maripaludis]MBA2840991.1 energy-coupling factor transport system substrate-specific component [Methanococcus maripaludis]MBA2853546.1 energy-coupling factor transport system substrate-specific component [Methanococcus maripaludis]MBA2860811.1 energy-coupling factor transport system substrate-specific component [Methanococcus maripaludis]MBA2868800.1 energy-coupling factor transport system substrate-specific component [Methanococcus maripaludis]MBB6
MKDNVNGLKIGREDYKKVLYRYLTLLSIVINIIGAYLVLNLNLPVYLDSVGTILAAILMGPLVGAFVGLATHFSLGVFMGPAYFYFAVVNGVIGLITGYIFKKYDFNLKTIISASIAIALIASLMGNSISYIVFSGITGESVDILTKNLLELGFNLFTAVYISGFLSNFLDKLISFAAVFYIMGVIIAKFKMKEFKIFTK